MKNAWDEQLCCKFDRKEYVSNTFLVIQLLTPYFNDKKEEIIEPNHEGVLYERLIMPVSHSAGCGRHHWGQCWP